MASKQDATCDSQAGQRRVGESQEPAGNRQLLGRSDPYPDASAGEKRPPPAEDETHCEASTYEYRDEDAGVIGAGGGSPKSLRGEWNSRLSLALVKGRGLSRSRPRLRPPV